MLTAISRLRPFLPLPSFFRALLPGSKESRGRLTAGILLFTLHYPLFTGGEAASAQSAAIISTVAGNGTGGYRAVDDGGAATAAQLNEPSGVAVDSSGNLYIADRSNNRIRKVDAASGNISTVSAGALDRPEGVALDGAGNIYIADTSNHRIRKVTPDGVISTAAGTGTLGFSGDNGPAASARLNAPSGVALDGAGNLYIADTSNHRIRKVTPDGMISTVAGGGTALGDNGPAASAQLFDPFDVALDGAGNLYIADASNDRIRKVTPDGVISTVAGTGTFGFSGDNGPAASARLYDPNGVALDGAGNLYIADTSNDRIRKVSSAGVISTVAGGGTALGDNGPAASAQLNVPAGLTFDCAGNLYIADFSNHRVRKVTALGKPCPPPPTEPSATEEAGPAVLARPFALSFLAAQDGEPATQPVTLHAQDGDADFQLIPSARWISVSPRRGRLAENERTTVTVTVDPAGLPEGTRRARLYVRSGGRVTAGVRVALEVLPPTGPAVSENAGVIHAARMSAYGDPGLFGPRLLPLAPGSAVIVQGVNFASGGRMEAAGYPLPTMLGGARVLIDGAAAPLTAVEPQRIEAQLPWSLGGEAVAAGGWAFATVVVETAQGRSYPRRFWAAPYAPGVFTASGSGRGQALAMFAETTDLAAPLGFSAGSRPARPGDVLEIYAAGLGAVEPPLADGMTSCPPDGVCLADGSNTVTRLTASRPRVWIGAYELAPENIRFSGLAPDLVCVNLVIVEVPRNLAPSDAAQLRLAVGGGMSQAAVTIAVE